MMKDDTLIFIEHILESIKIIEDYSKRLTKEKLVKDQKIQDAIIKRIEIIGEAAKNISDSFRKKYPHVDWKDIIGTRDVLIHHYFGVDLNIVWDIVKKDLPKLKENLEKIKKDISNSDNTNNKI